MQLQADVLGDDLLEHDQPAEMVGLADQEQGERPKSWPTRIG